MSLVDDRAVREVLSRYSLHLDGRDADALASLFADDARWEWGRVRLDGAERIARDLVDRQRAGSIQHIVVPGVVEIGDGEADAVSDVIVVHRSDPVRVSAVGRYHDRLALLDGRWVFRHRVLRTDVHPGAFPPNGTSPLPRSAPRAEDGGKPDSAARSPRRPVPPSPDVPASPSSGVAMSAPTVELPDADPETIVDHFERHGWGDGLPLVPPTVERVEAMLAAGEGAADEELGVLPLRRGVVTRHLAAVNAVLAGCPPRVFPVLETVVRILGDGSFNLSGVNPTTHPVAPLVVVHGDAIEAGGFNAGAGAFGPGCRANATLGRAVRLLLVHAGGAVPGVGDLSTQGQPSKYSFCIGENRAATPWEDYPTSRGVLSPSSVTVAALENPHNVHDMESETPERLLDKFASTIASLGSNHASAIAYEIFVALCPEHAATIAAAKWSRNDVQHYLFHRARLPAGALKGAFDARFWPRWLRRVGDDELIPLTDTPDNFRIFVTGGEGKHSSVLPSFSIAPSSVTRPIPEVPTPWQ